MRTEPNHHFTALADILNAANIQGRFTVTVLADDNGFPLAASQGDDEASETQSAVVAQIQKVVTQVQNHLGMDAPDELSLNDVQGKRLVCRTFPHNGDHLILAALIPKKEQTYRKLMNEAIRSIQQTLDGE